MTDDLEKLRALNRLRKGVARSQREKRFRALIAMMVAADLLEKDEDTRKISAEIQIVIDQLSALDVARSWIAATYREVSDEVEICTGFRQRVQWGIEK